MSGKVLVVDDDENLKDALEYILDDHGFEMVGLSNGKEAFDWLKVHASPLVVLLDLMMPGMSGREFIKILKKNHEIQVPPNIIIMSASVELDDELKCFDFLRKPFDISQMIEKIRGVL